MNTRVTAQTGTPAASMQYTPGSTLSTMWLIARRQAIEAMQTRQTLVMVGFSLALQTGMVLVSLRPLLQNVSPGTAGIAGTFIAFFLIFAGMMPCTTAVSIAAGVFAGDKERGCLLPMLVTPASNTAIFAGKVLGSILPALTYTTVGIVVYFAEVGLFFGFDKLGMVPIVLAILIILLMPAIALLGAALASLISSRVTTFQAAQNYTSIVLTILWFGFFGLVFTVSSWGLWVFALAVALVYLCDILFIAFSAATWKREEAIARL